ncbi:MAG: penicillin acylase family protein [Candidatus Dormibacteraeota bacterium]|uniref:Penicillin acylase family protein n=1 Tax=Candidatus Amunia macphersoniae TaxID=3127014 RepID=A0A934KQP4_9BACT|nr:penicillin acylase family protein [Candidatus Dormibacteraeota bacterium]
MRSNHSRRGHTRRLIAAATALLALTASTSIARADTWTPTPPTYQLNDLSGGNVLSILPPGEHGLYNAIDIAAFEASGTRPAGAADQLPKYQNLLYNAGGLTDAQLPNYFNDESFGIQGQPSRTETPSATVPVVIYRDSHEVPHIYAQDRVSLAYGAGYAAAEDRLFLMDVLRHYGAGNLSEFLGPSCADEHMDHNSLLLGGYTLAQKQAQLDALPTQYGTLGAELKSFATSYVGGINAYITATRTNLALLPADYAAALGAPAMWQATDVIDIATLVGGIFGKGGGNETHNAALLRYLKAQVGEPAAHSIFSDVKEQSDPAAPTTIPTPFPYERTGTVDPTKVALVDSATLTGGPTDTTPRCSLTPPSLPALTILQSLLTLPAQMSNALLVDSAHSADGHPIAVMGPQVSYYTPQILMQEDMHAPDFDAQGVAFPGTNFIIELGRGRDFAWSATSANTDNVDQVAEKVCDPNGGAPAAQGTSYLYKGVCRAMEQTQFTETAFPKPGGVGTPMVITHDVYYTVHGVVQGWTTVDNAPVAIVNHRSTYNHEVDSGVGFLRWNRPSYTHDPASFMQGAGSIQYTFNWFYADSNDIAYYQSGLDPLRATGVDPNLPAWGTGDAEWQGFLAYNDHPHAVGSPTGYMTSWNNKPAPGFGAADDNYTYGPVQRVQSLQRAIGAQLGAHGGRLTRANLVSAMEQAAAVDLLGTTVLPQLLSAVPASAQPAGVQAMLAALHSWLNTGALRIKGQPGDTQYAHTAAVVIMDELYPRVVRALFDNIFAAGGVGTQLGLPSAYTVVPEGFSQNPDQTGRGGSSYYSGLQSQVLKALVQYSGGHVDQPFTTDTTSRLCGANGLSDCAAALDKALLDTYNAMVSANSSTDVPSWTNNTETKTAGSSLPALDSIHFAAVGIATQPNIAWQNRPTFQQVVEFTGTPAADVAEVPAAPLLLIVPSAVMAALLHRRRRT